MANWRLAMQSPLVLVVGMECTSRRQTANATYTGGTHLRVHGTLLRRRQGRLIAGRAPAAGRLTWVRAILGSAQPMSTRQGLSGPRRALPIERSRVQVPGASRNMCFCAR
jgi:hypothetical protein